MRVARICYQFVTFDLESQASLHPVIRICTLPCICLHDSVRSPIGMCSCRECLMLQVNVPTVTRTEGRDSASDMFFADRPGTPHMPSIRDRCIPDCSLTPVIPRLSGPRTRTWLITSVAKQRRLSATGTVSQSASHGDPAKPSRVWTHNPSPRDLNIAPDPACVSPTAPGSVSAQPPAPTPTSTPSLSGVLRDSVLVVLGRVSSCKATSGFMHSCHNTLTSIHE